MSKTGIIVKRYLRSLLVGLGVLLFVVFIGITIGMYFFVNGSMHSDIPSPPPGYRTVSFVSADQTPLEGWYKGVDQPYGIAVLVHGVAANRLQRLPEANWLVSQGYSVLLFDLRNHGNSGAGSTTYGWMEKHDVAAAVDYARSLERRGPLIVWGLSLGAASSLMALDVSERIEALIAEAPYDTMLNTFLLHGRLYGGVPMVPVAYATAWLLSLRGGFDMEDVSAIEAVSNADDVPILFAVGAQDRRTPQRVTHALAQAHKGKSRIWVGQGRHAYLWRNDGDAYRLQVLRFLREITSAANSGKDGR